MTQAPPALGPYGHRLAKAGSVTNDAGPDETLAATIFVSSVSDMLLYAQQVRTGD